MITRFYVDNYKCLTNFEYKPKPFELIVGANGTGKTTVFEALRRLQDFIIGDFKAGELFSTRDITRGREQVKQRFELEVQDEDGSYSYVLELAHVLSSESEHVQVHEETLKFNGDLLFSYERRLRQDENDERGSYWAGELWAHENLGLDEFFWPSHNRSVISAFDKYEMPRTFRFQQRMRDCYFVRLNPSRISSSTNSEEMRPSTDLSNFTQWYRRLVQEKPGATFELYTSLRDAIVGFQELKFDAYGETARQLKVRLSIEPDADGKAQTAKFDLEELSDGQRALIALYTLLFCTLDANTTLVIDEPENYIALRELQPWLLLLRERLEEHGGQVILISHHPEFINQMAPESAIQFSRDNGGPVRVSPFNVAGFEGLTPAEIVARGFNDE